MTPFGKFVKLLLALTVAAAVVYGVSGCKKNEPASAPTPSAQAPAPGAENEFAIKVTEEGFVPSPIKLKKGVPVTLKVTRVEENTCATDFVLDEYNISQKLPLNETVTIRFTPDKAGELKYGCAMGKMVSGRFMVE